MRDSAVTFPWRPGCAGSRPGSARRHEVAAAARVRQRRALPCGGPATVICFVKVFSTSFSSHFVKINVPIKKGKTGLFLSAFFHSA